MAQDSVVSAWVTLADKNLRDELFERGVSDSHDQGLDRDEGAFFSCRGSPLFTSHLVWKVLLLLPRRVEHIPPGGVLYRFELVSLSVAVLSSACSGCGIRQTA